VIAHPAGWHGTGGFGPPGARRTHERLDPAAVARRPTRCPPQARSGESRR